MQIVYTFVWYDECEQKMQLVWAGADFGNIAEMAPAVGGGVCKNSLIIYRCTLIFHLKTTSQSDTIIYEKRKWRKIGFRLQSGKTECKYQLRRIGAGKGDTMEQKTSGSGDVQLSSEQVREELNRVNTRAKFYSLMMNSVYTLIVVAACAVLVAVIFLPVLRIYGTSMKPALNEGEIVVSIKGTKVNRGDILGVYYGSKLLIKRCIATERQWVEIDKDGNVYVDGEYLDEPYLTEKALGECNIDMPYQVPDGTIFVLGDHRETSIDSRNTSVGCISVEEVVGKIIFRIWPLNSFGPIDR